MSQLVRYRNWLLLMGAAVFVVIAIYTREYYLPSIGLVALLIFYLILHINNTWNKHIVLLTKEYRQINDENKQSFESLKDNITSFQNAVNSYIFETKQFQQKEEEKLEELDNKIRTIHQTTLEVVDANKAAQLLIGQAFSDIQQVNKQTNNFLQWIQSDINEKTAMLNLNTLKIQSQLQEFNEHFNIKNALLNNQLLNMFGQLDVLLREQISQNKKEADFFTVNQERLFEYIELLNKNVRSINHQSDELVDNIQVLKKEQFVFRKEQEEFANTNVLLINNLLEALSGKIGALKKYIEVENKTQEEQSKLVLSELKGISQNRFNELTLQIEDWAKNLLKQKDLSVQQTTEQYQKLISETRTLTESINVSIFHRLNDLSDNQKAVYEQLKSNTENFNEKLIDIFTKLSDSLNNSKEEEAKLLIENNSILLKSIIEQQKQFTDESIQKIGELNSILTTKINEKSGEILTGIKRDGNMFYRRVDSLLSINSTLKPNVPMPVLDDWCIYSDSLLRIINGILSFKRPVNVVEIGSGASTIYLSHILQKTGGTLYSFEHDKKYYAQTTNLIKEQNIKNVELQLLPLKTYKIDKVDWLWYDLKKAKLPAAIDVLIVDGPPGSIQKYSRYPAVPLLDQFINNKTLIFLDDALREDEKWVGNKWIENYGFTGILHDDIKGTFELKNKG